MLTYFHDDNKDVGKGFLSSDFKKNIDCYLHQVINRTSYIDFINSRNPCNEINDKKPCNGFNDLFLNPYNEFSKLVISPYNKISFIDFFNEMKKKIKKLQKNDFFKMFLESTIRCGNYLFTLSINNFIVNNLKKVQLKINYKNYDFNMLFKLTNIRNQFGYYLIDMNIPPEMIEIIIYNIYQ